MSVLFSPYRAGSLELGNRIVIAPMCQYSADNGRATDWHVIHLGHLALSGAAILFLEATAVTPEGRISPDDLGLWSDETEEALGRVLGIVRRYSAMPVGIQLAHAGRKASTRVPWEGGQQIRPGEPRGWQTVAPSPLPFTGSDHPPAALDRAGMAAVRDAFADAARRAGRLGLDAVQIHARTATCCTSSSPRSATGGRTTTAGAWRTGYGSRLRCSTRCGPRSRRTGR